MYIFLIVLKSDDTVRALCVKKMKSDRIDEVVLGKKRYHF